MHIYNDSIITFGIRGFYLGFSNTSRVDSLDRFRNSVVDKFKTEVCVFKYHAKEDNMKIKDSNEFVQKLGVSVTTTCVFQLIYDENHKNETKILQNIIIHGLVLCIKVDSYVTHMFCACLFCHNTAVPISIKKNKYCLSFEYKHYCIFLGIWKFQ